MFKAVWQQYFPPKPTFTKKDVPAGSQEGKVFLVTGANQGIGYELVKMLYPTGATIYLAGRSKDRVEKAIEQIKSEAQPAPSTPATLKFLHLDLSDLTTIKASAVAFKEQEKKLDILWNNAGIGGSPKGTTTKQGLEGHVGTNCVAPLLFTQELLPLLQEATKTASSGCVRVIWTGSLMIDTNSPKGGVDFTHIETPATQDSYRDYAASKAGNWFLAVEGAERWGKYGILSIVQNPGNLNTSIYANQPKLLMMLLKFVLYPPKMGGYTMLYAGFTKDVSLENNGAYIWPFGQTKENSRQDIYDAIKAGKATEFWEWCEKKYQPYI